MTNIPQDCDLKVINQKFMEPRHSHTEEDTIHGLIEREIKKTNIKIEVPQDWRISSGPQEDET